MEPDYEPVSREKYQAMLRAIDSAKQKYQRYTGLKRDQKGNGCSDEANFSMTQGRMFFT